MIKIKSWGEKMVILFSDRKSKTEKEIIEILTNSGATYISDKAVVSGEKAITIISEYKKSDIRLKKGIAILLDSSNRFVEQKFTKEIIGICEDTNETALSIFSKNPVAVISCGMSNKNTVTISSKTGNSVLITLQRAINSIYGETIEPAEYKIKLRKKYNEFSVMASVTVLLLYGYFPKEL